MTEASERVRTFFESYERGTHSADPELHDQRQQGKHQAERRGAVMGHSGGV